MKDFVHLQREGVDHSLPPSLFLVSHSVCFNVKTRASEPICERVFVHTVRTP